MMNLGLVVKIDRLLVIREHSWIVVLNVYADTIFYADLFSTLNPSKQTVHPPMGWHCSHRYESLPDHRESPDLFWPPAVRVVGLDRAALPTSALVALCADSAGYPVKPSTPRPS
jgi:hypothetical protein